MAKKKPSALDALTRYDEERLAMQTKGAELRRAAALELGLIVLDAGGSRLGTDALRRLIAGAAGIAPQNRRPEKETGRLSAEPAPLPAAKGDGTSGG